MSEDKLIDKITKHYDLNSSELYMCQNPLSSISGIIFTLYLPIIGNNKSTFVAFSYNNELETLNYDWYNLITSTSFFSGSYAYNKYYPIIKYVL